MNNPGSRAPAVCSKLAPSSRAAVPARGLPTNSILLLLLPVGSTVARRLWLRLSAALAVDQCGDAVDGVEERLGAGLDAVGRDGPAAIQLAVVLHLDQHLALGVLADRDAVDVEVAADDRKCR